MYKSVRHPTRRNVSLQHEAELERYLAYMSDYGWKAINLKGKAPDGILYKGTCCAVEILGASRKGNVYLEPTEVMKQKYDDYSMFDHVFIKTFYRRKVQADVNEIKRSKIDIDELLQYLD